MEPRKFAKHPEHLLHNVVNAGWINTVEKMLADGADPNARGKYGHTPLMLAVLWDHPVIAELLLNAGASTQATDDRGHTAIEMIPQGADWAFELLSAHHAKG